MKPLVHYVGLDEGETPGGQRGPDDRGADYKSLPRERRGGNQKPVDGSSPVWVREDSRGYVRDEDRADEEQHMLDAVKASS
jgi:hypothetical protein